MIFYPVLSEAILYQGKPLDLTNTLINFHQYLEKLVCQVLVLQSIDITQICSRRNCCTSAVYDKLYMYYKYSE